MDQHKNGQNERHRYDQKPADSKNQPQQPTRQNRNDQPRQGDPDNREAPRTEPNRHSGHQQNPQYDREREEDRKSDQQKSQHERVFTPSDKDRKSHDRAGK
jgi:hypothetical protein